MGTKLLGTVTLCTTLLKNKCVTSLRFSCSDNQINSWLPKVGLIAGLDHLQRSMERSSEQENRESLRKIILKHEEIFKQQVHELHRLYIVQKELMAELRNKMKLHPVTSTTPIEFIDPRPMFWSSRARSERSQASYSTRRHQPSAQLNPENTSLQRYECRKGPGCQESSPCSEDHSKTQRLFDLGGSAREEINTELWTHRDPNTGVLEQVEECDIELTLSIRCGSGTKMTEKWHGQGKESRCSKLITSETAHLTLSSTPISPDRQ